MKTPSAKSRLDLLLVTRGLATTRERAQALVLAGEVLVDGLPAAKPGMSVSADAALAVRAGLPYVSRGGIKLAHALDAFGLDVTGRVALDVGASTGGFTDCLLQRGAARVYAVDVGYGQLDWKLRQDPRVVVLEKTNIRHLKALPEQPTLAVADASFISLRLVLPAVWRLVASQADAVVLVKPQFEAGRSQVGKGGVVRDPAIRQAVVDDLAAWAVANGWQVGGVVTSPITGPAGNVEFLMRLAKVAPAGGA
ncbi:MAG: TlyA family RNA methyltransferase [Chloroflexota bacterium]|nr:TlyA family RNA methyltransferase [Chloroflexota bacterium]